MRLHETTHLYLWAFEPLRVATGQSQIFTSANEHMTNAEHRKNGRVCVLLFSPCVVPHPFPRHTGLVLRSTSRCGVQQRHRAAQLASRLARTQENLGRLARAGPALPIPPRWVGASGRSGFPSPLLSGMFLPTQ